jgi:enoyl-CoA hydratase/carnithine racemase
MDYETIKLATDGPFATLTLNRPNALNSYSRQMVDELNLAASEVENRTGLKALVIRGEGRAFCAGADLNYLGDAFDDQPRLIRYLRDLNDFFFRLEELPMPVIGVVHGFVLAGGLELMLACDMVIAAEDTRIGDQHANYGLMPGGGSTQRLPRKLGIQKAMELMLTGSWLSGKEAQELGLVLRAVPADKLDEELETILAGLRDKSATGLGWIKRTALHGQSMTLREGVAMEIQAFATLGITSPHPKEGIQAFKERREPKF